MPDELLSEEEAALVFRRAAELEATSPGERTGFDAGTLERIGAEAGLSPAAVRQAVAEVRAGRLAGDRGTAGRRSGVPKEAVIERRLAVPAEVVAERFETYLRRQVLRVCRRRGGLTVWEPARGLTANIVRGIDPNDRVRLSRVDGVELLVQPDDGGCFVRVVLDLSRVHRNARTGRFAGGALGAAGLIGGLVGAGLAAPEVLFVIPGTTAGAAGAYFGARQTYAKHVKRAVDAIELVLDELEHRRAD